MKDCIFQGEGSNLFDKSLLAPGRGAPFGQSGGLANLGSLRCAMPPASAPER
ncbi:hypothetical protein [Adhaeribacter radiodurans]|uniref:Uncharacterized protein n=1 Tax=Adhaeribacter radiodurans TaxID=2745197 RepID=A0A7L7LB67_9BACT|nr:hypothetical protein [Adhaeribacter radiodurans]QMU29964.1 hypothetical protein HUW48_18885 [Adhaeribacter radiodurans]